MPTYTAVGNKTRSVVATADSILVVRKKVAKAYQNPRQDIFHNDGAIIILKDGQMAGFVTEGLRMMKGKSKWKEPHSEICLWYNVGKDLSHPESSRILMDNGAVVKNPNKGLEEW